MSKNSYKMETIKPLYDYVLCKIIEREEKSDGGIIITSEDKNRNIQYAIVLAVGPGRKLDNMSAFPPDEALVKLLVKPGDKIIMAKYGGTDVGGDKFLIKEDHIWAIIED